MDAQRFDNLAKTLASRLSRRNALRGIGGGAATSLLAATGIRPDPAAALRQAENDDQPLFTLIRRYTLSVPTGQVRRALQQGYIDDACQAPGFVAYLTVEDEDGDFVTVAVFRSQQDMQNFATAEATWIAQNLDDLLPAPDEAISGDTYVHGVASQGFSNTCPAGSGSVAPTRPTAPTAAPGQPTTAPAPPTAAPSGPTPTPAPACTAQGCTCSTGTQAPCDDGLICCPTTDLLGGPGVCQTEAVCYPNECRANGRNCPRSCGTTEACPNCCSNYCNGDGVCDDPPAACTGENCACTPGVEGACDSGLVCCTTTGTAGTLCLAPEVCASALCPQQYCGCQTGVAGACNAGLVCCSSTGTPGGEGVCLTEAECTPSCTGQGCGCSGGVQGACDDGLICCQDDPSVPGGPGTCQSEAQCAPAPCTGAGCACTTGTQSPCDSGLICCGTTDTPGGPGTCQTEAECSPSCTGQGCGCSGGVEGACDAGLICCQDDPSVPGGPGTCQPASACGPAPCSANGVGCDATCNWGDSCSGCCSGYCNSAGVCDSSPPPATCIADGVNCGATCNWSDSCAACCSGFCDGAGNCNEPGASAGACGDEGCGCELANPACVAGLVCCDDGSGVTGTCATGC